MFLDRLARTRRLAIIALLFLPPFLSVDASHGIARKIKSTTGQESGGFHWDGAHCKYSNQLDPRLRKAVVIAEGNARPHSIRRCWRYVKRALLAAKVVNRYPGTRYAKSAGGELSRNFGFKKLPLDDPFEAPVGSVLVYGGRGAGHVEFRTTEGFVSDFVSPTPSPRPLIGVYFKPVSS